MNSYSYPTKLLIAIKNSSGKGKTETIREFAKQIFDPSIHKLLYLDNIHFQNECDFRLVIEINGIIIGMESKGDPNTYLKDRLYEIYQKYSCDIILCSTRLKGETIHAINHFDGHSGFSVIWTSTYVADKSNANMFNGKKAEHVLDLIKFLNYPI